MRKNNRQNIYFVFLGLGSLLWFLYKVITKPSRLQYPCMKATFPIAVTFLSWLFGVASSMLFLKRGLCFIRQFRYAMAVVCLMLGVIAGAIFFSMPTGSAFALSARQLTQPNKPIGVALGVKPGRVVWAHDFRATKWAGLGDGHWWQSDNTDQETVNRMFSRLIRELSGKENDTEAWDAFFKYFNKIKNQGDVGYTKGEKIAIKVNLVGAISSELGEWGGVDENTLDFYKKHDYMNSSPQVMLAILRQLVNVVGANQKDISIGDPTTYFPNEFYNPLHAEFPNVVYIDCQGKKGRTRAEVSNVTFNFSCRPKDLKQDYIPKNYAEAKYLINVGNLKSHSYAGTTLGAKNHFGSLVRLPTAEEYYDMHNSLPHKITKMGQYRVLVDLLGHAHLGGKTLLSFVDGLYGGVHPFDSIPFKWKVEPFNNHWTSSLFASQDPVAIESMLFDLMQLEGDPRAYPQMPGVEDYLIESALANDPPSKTYYDPDHKTNTQRLKSLGVHERWNNDKDRKYSRNLKTGEGIELITVLNAGTPVILPVKHANSSGALSIRCIRGGRGMSLVEIAIPKSGNVAMNVFDVQGRNIGSAFNGYLNAGVYKVNWTDKLTGAYLVPNGLYVLYLSNNKERIAHKVTYAVE